MKAFLAPLLLFLCPAGFAADVAVPGLREPVEILRDRWGVPHIYARNTHDLFFAQGWTAALDRLWQIDLWRRSGTGKLAEVLGPGAVERDRLARALLYRGDREAEWASYGPDTRAIVTAFTEGINAYIRSLGGRRPLEFRVAGYDPGFWEPEDCLARLAGLLMTRNLSTEVTRAMNARRYGLALLQKHSPPEPSIPLEIPKGLDLEDIGADVLRGYRELTGPPRFPGEGSNNWVVDGTMSATGKPLLASDPHRALQIPSLRKTVHLVAPGWNVVGAGEPALPGIALGHNDRIAFGFTIVGIDQQDLYLETLNPANRNQYRFRGTWKAMDVERQQIAVRGGAPRTVEIRYTVHGPVIHEDGARHRAYALRWVGSEAGTAGYLAGLSLARARNWNEFLAGAARFKVPSQNLVYADVDGNIGWQVVGLSPIRPTWSGLFPVPGDGTYEWSGFRDLSELPRTYNPPERFVATANHNILPPGYTVPLGYEWGLPFRFDRIREMLSAPGKFTVADFERMQQDVVSLPARRFQAILRKWNPENETVRELLAWDGAMRAGSRAAAIYKVWMDRLPAAMAGQRPGPPLDFRVLLQMLEEGTHAEALAGSLASAQAELRRTLGPDRNTWTWGRLHRLYFRHPLDRPEFHRGPLERPGDAHTVNAASGSGFLQSAGASYRQIIDLADWDRSVMTNVPGESGDPSARHYADLLEAWADGRYHRMVFSRPAVEAAARERISLMPSAARDTASPAAASTK
ncbi:MAG TPA: penicillin acylase family protein [Bryobacteraceae bacterium]|nr:penicillin acylase family protein [Bryobacteraceae bacterium]